MLHLSLPRFDSDENLPQPHRALSLSLPTALISSAPLRPRIVHAARTASLATVRSYRERAEGASTNTQRTTAQRNCRLSASDAST